MVHRKGGDGWNGFDLPEDASAAGLIVALSRPLDCAEYISAAATCGRATTQRKGGRPTGLRNDVS